MPVPDFQTLMLPVLKFFSDGRERPSRDAHDPIAKDFRLTEDQINEVLPSGRQTRFANRVAWAISYLKQAQCLESPHRGVYKITSRGREVLAETPINIDINYLMRFPEFVAFRNAGDADNSSVESWYLEEDEALDDLTITEYDITATPNDFNVRTICDFMESGLLKIPGFQRNYVWDIKRASKLIESLIIGLPIPQVFLYEESRNSFLVIDGQQRLMSLYYFRKGRFPRLDNRPALRRIFDENGRIPDNVLMDDDLFTSFNLQLPSPLQNQPNKFHRLNYAALAEYQTTLDLRTIRNVIIRQSAPVDDDSSIYEIFNRLNTGGVNLTPQEIRVSLYHSNFYSMLDRVNLRPRWRRLIGLPEPDLHTKDLEILLLRFR